MNKSRQQFEETIKKLSASSEFELKLKRANNGLNYADQHVDLMWISWQESRESLEVELPDLGDVILDDYFVDGFNDAISEIKTILISNGVKIKNGN